jgi:hypothetical protein
VCLPARARERNVVVREFAFFLRSARHPVAVVFLIGTMAYARITLVGMTRQRASIIHGTERASARRWDHQKRLEDDLLFILALLKTSYTADGRCNETILTRTGSVIQGHNNALLKNKWVSMPIHPKTPTQDHAHYTDRLPKTSFTIP